MSAWFQRLSVAFLAGAIGGFVQGLVQRIIQNWGYLRGHISFGTWFTGWGGSPLASVILAGALWGLLCVPLAMVLRLRGLLFGVCLALVPAAYMLFWRFPATHHDLSPFVPHATPALLIVLGSLAWGLVAGTLYQANART
jgi:hypothetical protein